MGCGRGQRGSREVPFEHVLKAALAGRAHSVPKGRRLTQEEPICPRHLVSEEHGVELELEALLSMLVAVGKGTGTSTRP